MRHHKFPPVLLGLALAGLVVTMLLVSGCTEMTGSPATGPAMASSKGGAQLWSQNCMRCHNLRSPSAYSDAEWQVIVHHMRIRAGLSSEEQRIITQFLQSAN